MDKTLGILVALQLAIMAANEYNNTQLGWVLPEAAAQGQDIFDVPQVADIFSVTGTSLTMVNGWKSVKHPNKCSVNLVHSDTGIYVEEFYGFFFELHAPARRFPIDDCSKLPERIFKPLING